MKYKKAKKQRTDTQKAYREAENKLDDLGDRKVSLMNEFEQSYEALTDARAQRSIGEGSADDVKKAEKANRKLKEQLEQLKTDIEVQKKTVSLLKDRFKQSEADFQQVATGYYRDKLTPIFEQLADTVDQANELIEQVNNVATESNREGIQLHTKGVNQQSTVNISKGKISGLEQRNFINPKTLR